MPMPFVKRLTRIGSSTGLIIDRGFLQQIDLAPDSEVEVSVEDNAIVIRPHRYADDTTVATVGHEIMTKRRKLMKRLSK
jgi:antitoxin component of MazEF toxin-antitoxin module